MRWSGHQAWLTDRVDRGAATGIDDHRPTQIGLWPAATVVGGLLPDGAVAARVTDRTGQRHEARVGGGAWIEVLDQPPDASLAVCFLDVGGQIVRPVLPADWARVHVDDADEPCPACDATTWEQVTADDESRGSSGSGPGRWSPTPFVVCRTCGHEESGGSWFGVGDTVNELSPEELERLQREWEEQFGREKREMLRKVAFPIYTVEGVRLTLEGWGGSGMRAETSPERVTLSHGEDGVASISVETDAGAQEITDVECEAQGRLAGLMEEPLECWPERSQPGLTIWLRHRERQQERAAARAQHGRRRLLVDGVAVEFAVSGAGDRWVAVAKHGALTLAVTARGYAIDDVHLRALTDPLYAEPEPGDPPPPQPYRPLPTSGE